MGRVIDATGPKGGIVFRREAIAVPLTGLPASVGSHA